MLLRQCHMAMMPPCLHCQLILFVIWSFVVVAFQLLIVVFAVAVVAVAVDACNSDFLCIHHMYGVHDKALPVGP